MTVRVMRRPVKLAAETRVEPTEAFREVYPLRKVTRGTVLGLARKQEGYRVQWDGKVSPETIYPRFIRAIIDGE